MTGKLYWVDSYMKEFDAAIVKASGNEVVLDKTAFYPTGGGQPNDTGKLVVEGKEYSVIDVKKGSDGEIIHILDTNTEGIAGKNVHGVIDWERRYAHMRHHTAVHIVDAVLEKQYGSGKMTGGQIYADRARFDIDMPELDRQKANEIIEKSSVVAKEGHDVTSRIVSREEALAMPNLIRTEPGSELVSSLEEVRLVEIVGLDAQSDGGTHVKNTGEVGGIVLSKYENKGKHNKRVEISLQAPWQKR